MYMNAGNAEYSVSTALTRLDTVRIYHQLAAYSQATHFVFDSPTFFMNAITSDSLKLPLASVPIVS